MDLQHGAGVRHAQGVTEHRSDGPRRAGRRARGGACRRRGGRRCFLATEGLVDYSARQDQLLASVTVDEETGCWLWREDQLNADGYGNFYGKGAHRISYEAFVGPIPPGLAIDHLCRRRSCVAPGHLEPVTLAENTRRAVAHRQADPSERVHHGAKRWCIRGHELDDNRRDGLGKRYCYQCRWNHQRRLYPPKGVAYFHIDAEAWLEARPHVAGRGQGPTLTSAEVAEAWGMSVDAFKQWRKRNPGLLDTVGGGGPGRRCLFDAVEAREILRFRKPAWSRLPRLADPSGLR